mmetsp:Transcript_13760/g.28833  ORF Transcript_13760/g.28833 Transcript_13760/m.28833 type:complete len:142 (+) Transcript_13760:35-460(+)
MIWLDCVTPCSVRYNFLLTLFFLLDSFHKTQNNSGKRGSLERPSMKLDSIEGDGPIYTVITELKPDTILINELDKATGRVVMTSSLSLVVDQSAAKSVTELIQVSHEVGSSTTNNKSAIIEGHQVWRFRKTDTLPKEVTWQ